ncbi:hypothetical protein TNCV_4140341 [Trichonephila clavipes]|nr:hypothetical protein TNCV_4140341 [Trichonephila clavipes]
MAMVRWPHSNGLLVVGLFETLVFHLPPPLPTIAELNSICREIQQQRTFDEAHFWLNGYANKQKCRIWSEANPQVYVEAPLHPEKLTVWCALWARGILQKR